MKMDTCFYVQQLLLSDLSQSTAVEMCFLFTEFAQQITFLSKYLTNLLLQLQYSFLSLWILQ